MLNVGGGSPHQGPFVRGLTITFNNRPPQLGEINGSQCSARGQNKKWPTCGHSGYLTCAPRLTPRNITGAFSRSPW